MATPPARHELALEGRTYTWNGAHWLDNRGCTVPLATAAKLDQLLMPILQEEDQATSEPLELTRMARRAREAKQMQRALSLARRALELDPSCLGAAAVLCAVHRECGNPRKALAETDHISKSHPALLTSRAAAMCDLERWEDAKRTLARALAMEASGEAFAVVARIKKFQPDLYPDSI